MKVILFGATGMIGQGVLRECLLDPEIEHILLVGRHPLGQSAVGDRPSAVDKVTEIVHPNLFDLSPIESQLAGYDACFFCLGVSSAGMSEAEYSRVTYDLTMAAAGTLAKLNPNITFVYVSGAGTDSTERGRSMWARVKGRTENALLALLPNAYMFRPALIQPMHGIRSRTTFYRIFYALAAPLMPLLRRFSKYVTTTERLGRAMINAAKNGAPKRVLESADINALA